MLPETGYLRLPQIIGQKSVSLEEAAENKVKADSIRKQYPILSTEPVKKEKETKNQAKKLAGIGPRSPRPAIPAIVPWSKSKLWQAVSNGEFPKPVRLSIRTTAWRVEDIRSFCAAQR
jgi:hypothetical protein